MVSPWLVAGALGGTLAVFVAVFFPRARSRLIAAVTLAPLVLVATAIAWTGRTDRSEGQELQDNPTVFGAGTVPGESHAAGAGPALGGAAPEAAAATGPTAEVVAGAAGKVPGITLGATPDGYTPSTLWNRMDGGAEHYTKQGLVRAALVTASLGATDFEVQVFDMGTADKAKALFEATERDAASRKLMLGDAAVTWSGGGELHGARFYARVVASSAEPTEVEAKTVEALLGALAASAGGQATAATEAASDAVNAPPTAASPTAEPEVLAPVVPPIVPEAAVPGPPAARLGAPAHFAEVYGLERVVEHGAPTARVLEAPLPSAIAAAALAQALRPAGAKVLERFGWATEDAAMLVRGASLWFATESGAEARALAAAGQAPTVDFPGLTAFDLAVDVEPLLVGWGGRSFLGPALVGHLDGPEELVVACPADVDVTWKALVKSLPGGRTHGGVFVGTDPLSGQVLARRAGAAILIASGFSDVERAREMLATAVSRLAPTP